MLSTRIHYFFCVLLFSYSGSSLVLLALVAASSALLTKEPTPPAPVARQDPVELWFPARLDHFDASNNDTFNMRFYYNDEFADSNLLIFVGGEWSISPGWLRAGLMYDTAAVTGSAMFYTEHRYYGQTRPTDDTSVENLRYLTVDQALADLVQFIQYVKSDRFEGGRYSNGSVGLVGCSLAGSMATWTKLAYPHLVDVVFSDSGPLHAQEDFPEYLEVITSALRTQGSDACVSSIEEAMVQLTALLQTATGPAQVSEMFGTCSVLSAGTPLDLATFFWFGITENFAYLVQYAVPGDIADACAILTDESVASPVQRLGNWIRAQPWSQPCIETRYTEVVAAHTNTSYDAYDSVMRLWTYQTCVEFGWYQTTSSTDQPFLTSVPLEYFHQMCRDFFGTYFDESRLRAGIERSNLFFGGLTYMPDHVVSVAGTGDPWSPMGPRGQHATTLSPVHVVADVSHCRAVRPIASSETAELQEVKESVRDFLYEHLVGPVHISSAPMAYGTAVVWLLALLAIL